MKHVFTAAVLVALASASFAQNFQQKDMPSQADIAAKHKATMDALNSVNIPNRAIQQQMKSNNANAAAAAAVNGAAPVPAATKADFMNLAKPGSARKDPSAANPDQVPADLMIFVSLSMPERMLEQYAIQAKRFNAVLMMRGFANDKLSDTKAILSRLNKSGAQWEISPEPFKHFLIDKVPAIVMATAESASITEEGCAKPETYSAVFGDISVLDALDKFSLRAQKPIAVMAKARIQADREAGKTQ